MRKILQITMIFSLLLSLTYISHSQTLEIVSSEETVSGSPSSDIKAHVVIKNTSNADVIVWASARKVKLVEGQKYLFCDVVFCYQSTDGDELLADDSFTLGPGEQTPANVMYIGLEPNGLPGQSIVSMKFEVEGIIPDSVVFTATFDVLTSVADNPEMGFLISEATPNPATDMIEIEYEIAEANGNARLSIYDIFGDVVKEIELNPGGQSINVDVSSFVPGTYFYRVNSRNENFSSKFVISR